LRRRVLAYYINLLAVLALEVAHAVPEEQYVNILKAIFDPVQAIVETLFALAFGVGLVGFFVLVARGLLNWSIGGSIGRSVALRNFESAVEALAVIPISFIIVEALKATGVEGASQVAELMEDMLLNGFENILSILRA